MRRVGAAGVAEILPSRAGRGFPRSIVVTVIWIEPLADRAVFKSIFGWVCVALSIPTGTNTTGMSHEFSFVIVVETPGVEPGSE